MFILLFVYVICTVLIGLGFSGRVDYPYSKFTTIFGMPVLIWFMLGQVFHGIMSHYHLHNEDEVEWLRKLHNIPE